jgi:hypothetical protein
VGVHRAGERLIVTGGWAKHGLANAGLPLRPSIVRFAEIGSWGIADRHELWCADGRQIDGTT